MIFCNQPSSTRQNQQMKKIFSVAIVLIVIFCTAQTNRFVYELEYRKDSTEEYRKNLMALDINPKLTKFYDYNFVEYDSINKKGNESLSRYSTKTDQVLVRGKNSNRNIWYRDFFDYFTIQTTDEMKWKLFSETKIYDGYKLQKATTEFGGRNWIAWFSKEVNISEGPYKFRGLPGLIFLLEDSGKDFIYKLVKNQKLKKTFETKDFLETHYGKVALPITISKFNTYIQDIYNDPTRMFSDRIKNGEKANFKDETIETVEELNRKKAMLQKGIKSRYIYIEKNLQPNFLGK